MTRRPWMLVALVAVMLLGGCGLSLQRMPKPGGLDEPTYALTARFTDVLNLPANAEVREGARVVGEVGAMRTDGYEARVTLHIIRGIELPRGTRVEVRFDNPLGDQYVEVTRPDEGQAGVLRPGDEIGVADTSAAPTVEDTLGAFATVLTGGGIGDIQTIAHELNQAFHGQEDKVRSLLGNLDTSAELLAQGIGPLTKALEQVARLSERLAADSGTLVQGIDEIGPAITVLARENDDFDRLLRGLDSFGRAGQRIVDRSGDDTVAALEALVPVVDEIVASRERLTPVLENLRTLAAQVPKVTRYGYARADVTMPVAFDSRPSTATSSPTVRSLMTALGPVQAGAARGTGGTR